MNRFSFEKGMEIVEQGGKTAIQQVKSTVQGQVTGQQQNPQNPQQPKLDSLKSQILGNGVSDSPKLDSVKAQVTGIIDTPKKPHPVDQAIVQNAQQVEDAKFKNDLYGIPDDPNKLQQMQQTLDPQNMLARTTEEQKQQQAIKSQLEYVKTEIDDKMAQYRQQRVEVKAQEEHVEEQKKMQDLQVKEEKKDKNIALTRAVTKTEAKVGGG